MILISVYPWHLLSIGKVRSFSILVITSVFDPNNQPVKNSEKPCRPIPLLLAGYALLQIFFVVFLCFNHAAFPLNLEAMELTGLQHVARIMAGLPLYPEPTADYIPLAYNPLFYYLCIPFVWIFGINLFAIRLVAILGFLGSGVILFFAVRKASRSSIWGLIAIGLFASAYQAMDTYLDNAHRDSWLLFSLLLGCYLIDSHQSKPSQANFRPDRQQFQTRTLLVLWINFFERGVERLFQKKIILRLSNAQTSSLLGILLMVAAFWFKQQGSVFLLGALLYLTWREGWRSWLYWLVGLVLAPVLYLAVPDKILGSQFHYFTWLVPRHWFQPSSHELLYFLRLMLRSYGLLAVVGTVVSAIALWRTRRHTSIWHFMLPFALLSGILATLTPGSNNNVFIPAGTWCILVGTLGFKQIADTFPRARKQQLHLWGLVISFALLWYNPLTVIVPPRASDAYKDLVGYLKSLDGTVYAPWIGQLQDGYKLYPAAHWVPLNDIIRGPGVDQANHPFVRELLESVRYPQGQAYILHNLPLDEDTMLSFLSEKYTLEVDLGDRFNPLSTLPKRYTLHYPRYLYRGISQGIPPSIEEATP